jgi:hypothetical protein
MNRLVPFAAALLLFFSVDNPRVLPWRPNSAPSPDVLAGAKIPLLPDFEPPPDSQQTPNQNSSGKQGDGQTQDVRDVQKSTVPLTQPSELALVRYVDGEFAHMVRSLPAGREGFIMHPLQPFNDQLLHRQLSSKGAAVNPGDSVQITALQFKKNRIVLLLNGGGNKGSWRDRIQYGISGLPTMSSSPDNNGKEATAPGSTLVLDFEGPIPEMTPDQLKAMLSPVLNFSHERSAALQWSQTLPPEMQRAITEKRAVIGMTRDMVEAAIGKPDKKVRERNSNGDDTEDWIYGQPPAITMFIEFIGEKVTSVKQFPKEHIAER